MEDTLAAALRDLVPGSTPVTGEQKAVIPGSTTTTTTAPGTNNPTTTTTTPPPPATGNVASLIAQQATDFANADAALRRGDLATYQADIVAAEAIQKQLAILVPGASPTTTTTPTTGTTTTTATSVPGSTTTPSTA